MVGLRTQGDTNDAEFVRYFTLVQAAASKLGKVFFLDTEEGRNDEVNGFIVSDLSGWLVDMDRANEFGKRYIEYDTDDEMSDKNYCFAEWQSSNDELFILFKRYDTVIPEEEITE